MEEHKRIVKRSRVELAQLILTAAILAIMIIVGVVLVGSVARVQKTMTLIETDLQNLDMDEMNNAVTSLKNAAGQLEQLDMESLNGLITSLNNTASALNGITDTMGGLFNWGSGD